MSVIDIVLLVAALLFAVTGWRRGLVYGLLSLVGFLTGAAVGLWLAPQLVDSWADGLPKALSALAIVFIFAALGQVPQTALCIPTHASTPHGHYASKTRAEGRPLSPRGPARGGVR